MVYFKKQFIVIPVLGGELDQLKSIVPGLLEVIESFVNFDVKFV